MPASRHTALDPSDDLYAIFEIPCTADAQQLRRAWRRIVMRWHPDRAGPSATRTFQYLLAAYETLADPASRAAYDRQRNASGPDRGRFAQSGSAAASTSREWRRATPGVMLSHLSGPLTSLLACGVAEL